MFSGTSWIIARIMQSIMREPVSALSRSILTSRSVSLYLDTIWFSFYCCLCALGFEPCDDCCLCFRESLSFPCEDFGEARRHLSLPLSLFQPLSEGNRTSVPKASLAVITILIQTRHCHDWWNHDWNYKSLEDRISVKDNPSPLPDPSYPYPSLVLNLYFSSFRQEAPRWFSQILWKSSRSVCKWLERSPPVPESVSCLS